MSTLHRLEYNLQSELEHGNYVSRLAGAIATEMGVDDTLAHDVRVAGLLHDIGKLRLKRPDNQDTLDIEELGLVRLHSMHSYEIVKEAGYNEQVQSFVRFHHENYDGTGYPEGLVGEQIPKGARIIRASDVFAALTTERPYRKGFPMDTAIELMIEEITHFDMEVFLAFQNVVHRVGTSYYEQLDPMLIEELQKADPKMRDEDVMLAILKEALVEDL